MIITEMSSNVITLPTEVTTGRSDFLDEINNNTMCFCLFKSS